MSSDMCIYFQTGQAGLTDIELSRRIEGKGPLVLLVLLLSGCSVWLLLHREINSSIFIN